MKNALTVIDDLLPESVFQEIRNTVLHDGFKTVMVDEAKGHPATQYHTVNVEYNPPEIMDAIVAAIGKQIKLNLQAFRLGAENSPLHNFVHADHTCSELAAVFYLNLPDQCLGGTAFFRHKLHGWDAMPTSSQLEEAKYDIEQLKADWQDPTAWILASLAGMKTNRVIIYPSQSFHSRFPWEAFGDSNKPETCRLVYCAFFDILK